MTVETNTRSITAIAPALASRATSPVQLVEGCLERIAAARSLNAFITVRGREAHSAAHDL